MFKKTHNEEQEECQNEKKALQPTESDFSFSIVFFKMALIVCWRTWENPKFPASATFLGQAASETLFFLGQVIPVSSTKLFLSIFLIYLSATAIIFKSDIFQLIHPSWYFLTFQIIRIKYYILSILSLLLFLQSTEPLICCPFSQVIISPFVQLAWMAHW